MFAARELSLTLGEWFLLAYGFIGGIIVGVIGYKSNLEHKRHEELNREYRERQQQKERYVRSNSGYQMYLEKERNNNVRRQVRPR